jgi:integrase
MPKARPRIEPVPPAPMTPTEADFVKQTVRRFYGNDAIVRNYGPDPKRLELHVETDVEPGMERHECLGLLMCDLMRDYVGLEVTKRGRPARGSAKIAYRQGEVI